MTETAATGGDPAGARALLRALARRLAGLDDPAARLAAIPRIVAEFMLAEVCSIYLLRQRHSLELSANTGLHPAAVGRVRLRIGEGLVGRVARTGAQLATVDAPNERGFRYIPEIGEEPLQSFLGVPIRRGARMLGVLVVQNRAARRYPEEDRDAMALVALVIAEMVGNEQLQPPEPATAPVVADGVAASPGLAIGTVVLAEPRSVVTRPIGDDAEVERRRLAEAVQQIRQRLSRRVEVWAAERPADGTGIVDAHQRLLADRGWRRRMERRIEAGLSAEAAVKEVRDEVRARLEGAADPHLRESFRDFEEWAARLLQALLGPDAEAPAPPADAILVARDAGPAALLGESGAAYRAVVLAEGSSGAHAAVLARGLDLPMLVQAGDAVQAAEDGDRIIADADRGRVFLRPTAEVLAGYRDQVKLRRQALSGGGSLRGKPARSRDGVRVRVRINASLATDAALAAETGADGIGLYRTEFQFLASRLLPEEEQLQRTYARVLAETGAGPVTFRTLDLGSDKPLPGLRAAAEANPALGQRALRIGFEQPWLLRMQIAALLRAAAGRRLRVMFPLVADAAEFRTASRMVAGQAAAMADGPAAIRVGAMLETPSLAFAPDSFYREVDFLSVGGNDLLQFFFAADRGNERLADRFPPMHGAFLRFLRQLAARCREHRVPLSFCGDAAGDPVFAVALAALGFGAVSVRPAAVAPVKRAIRSADLGAVARFLERALESGADTGIRTRLRALLAAGVDGPPPAAGDDAPVPVVAAAAGRPRVPRVPRAVEG